MPLSMSRQESSVASTLRRSRWTLTSAHIAIMQAMPSTMAMPPNMRYSISLSRSGRNWYRLGPFIVMKL